MRNLSDRLSEKAVEQYRPNILTLANQLTILRLVFVPVFLILLVYDRSGWALVVFFLAGLTDALDGLIARRFGQKTSVGAILDPIADKLLMNSSIVVLSLERMAFANPVPVWLMLLVIFRDAFILLGGLAFILTSGFRIFPPTIAGKTSTALQVVTLLAVLLYNWMGLTQPALYVLFVATGLMTVFSGLQYLIIGRRLIEG